MNTFGACILAALAFLSFPGRAPAAEHFDEGSFVQIGGIDQWVRIVGEDRANPILLMLHGGPGATLTPWMTIFRPWESHFTLVYWDQRGAGKTYTKNGQAIAETITIDRMAADGIEVSEHLARQFAGRKIILLGHSWGSMLGIEIARKRPDLFEAFVGTGQVVNMREGEARGYAEVLRRARAAGNAEAVAELTKIGPPPYTPTLTLATERKWASILSHPSEQKFNSPDYLMKIFPPDFLPPERKERMDGFLFSNLIMYGRERMDGPVMDVDLASSATQFAVPIYFFQGEFDAVTPTSLVKDYYEKINAPRKKLELLPGDHNAVLALPEAFLTLLRRDISGQGAKTPR